MYGTVGLYECKGVRYALKVQPLLDYEIFKSEDRIILSTCRFTTEFAFARLIMSMPKSEEKYFTKLAACDIAKNTFDTSKLIVPTTHNIRLDEKESKKYCIRLLYAYAGDTLDSILDKMIIDKVIPMDYKFTSKLATDLITIIRILRKYKYLLGDMHGENICYSKSAGNFILIDYGHVLDTTTRDNGWVYESYNNNADYVDLIRILTNYNYYFKKSDPVSNYDQEFILREFKSISASKYYKDIRKYFIKFNNQWHIDGLDECEHKNYTRIEKVIVILRILYLTLDYNGFQKFWSANFDNHTANIPLLLKPKDLKHILDRI
jgi:hypothetical protein